MTAAAPKTFAFGLIATAILAGLVPFLVLESLAPVLRDGVQLWLASVLPDIGVTGLVMLPLVVGLPRRGPWYVRLLCTLAGFVLAAFALGVLLGLGILAGVPPSSHPNLRFMSYLNLLGWLFVSPLAWLIWRMLQGTDWRPWASGEAGPRAG